MLITTPPSICPSTLMGFTALPTSWAATRVSSFPVSSRIQSWVA